MIPPPSFKIKHWVLKTGGVAAYAEATSGGKGKACWPRQVQSPIEPGWVGSSFASPEGSVPAGKILPLIMNSPSSRVPEKNPFHPVRQSHAISTVRVFGCVFGSPSAFITPGSPKTATAAKPARPETNRLKLVIRFKRSSFGAFA